MSCRLAVLREVNFNHIGLLQFPEIDCFVKQIYKPQCSIIAVEITKIWGDQGWIEHQWDGHQEKIH
jgi:hypothetical protein